MDNFMFNNNETLHEFIENNSVQIQDFLGKDDLDQSQDKTAYELIIKLRDALNSSEDLVMELQAPLIPSIVPNTILVPITGRLTEDRFDAIRAKILNNLNDINFAIIDFTAIHKENIDEIGIESMSLQISQLNSSLHLMGVEAIYVGFSPDVIKGIVYAGVDVNHLNCQLSFKTALQYLMKKKEMSFAATPR